MLEHAVYKHIFSNGVVVLAAGSMRQAMRPLTERGYDAEIEIIYRCKDARKARSALWSILWAEPVLVDGHQWFRNVPTASQAMGVPERTIVKALLGKIGYLHPRGHTFDHYPREYPAP